MFKGNKFFYIIVILLVYAGIKPELSIASDYRITTLEASADKMRLKIDFDEPELISESNQFYAVYKNSNIIVDQSRALVPYITKFFNLAEDKEVKYTILKLKKKSHKVKNYFTVKSDSIQPFDVQDIVSVQYLGKYRDLSIFALKIFPVKYNPASSVLEWIETLEVELKSASLNARQNKSTTKVNVSQKEFLSSFLINNTESIYKLSKSNTINNVPSSIENTGGGIFDKDHLFKIAVKEYGLYKITYNDLIDADYPISRINPKKLCLYNKGLEIPVYFKGAEDGSFDSGDYFEFWGEKNEKTFLDQFPDMYADPFSDENIYWLAEGADNGRRLIEESGGIVNTQPGSYLTPYVFKETLHFEKDNFKENFGHSSSNINRPAYEIDHWYYDSGICAVGGRSYDFHLPYPYEQGAGVFVKAVFRGKSYLPPFTSGGHQVDLWLNNEIPVDEIGPSDGWKNQNMRILGNQSGIAQSIINHGTNQIQIHLNQPDVTDIVLLNWFDVTYLRKYRTDNNILKFRLQEDFPDDYTIQFEVDGFSGAEIDVYKIGVSKIINGRVDYFKDVNNFSSYRLTIQDEIFDPDVEYVALTENEKKKPLYIEEFKPWKNDNPDLSLLDNSNAADYLIITDDLFYNNCLQLKSLKEDKGLRVEVVTVENIYDVFNCGVKSPIAIKDFLEYACQNWDQTYPLNYVVLVGDGSYDYKGRIKPGSDIVPTIMYETDTFGFASADYWYSLISGDDYIPDLIISRIPVNTNQQLSDYLDKIENYENNPDIDLWRNSALFISGNDASGSDLESLTNKPIFRAQNLRLINMQLPNNTFARRLNTVKDENIQGYDPDFGSTTDLIEYFDDGLSFINFFGHGGGAIWADVQLLNLSDIDRLNNGYKLPFIASMTCFTGAFENPGKESLGEKLLLAPEKGAIAVLAASGVGWKYNDLAIEWGLFQYLWDNNLTFGEAVNLMKIFYLANPIYYTENGDTYTPSYYSLYKSMVSQFNLFGDPSLKLQKPDKDLSVTVDNQSPPAGSVINVTVSGDFSSGSGRLEVTDINNHQIYDTTFSYQPPAAQISFSVPHDSISDGKSYFIKAYIGNGIEDAAGYAKISVQKPIITSIVVEPEDAQVEQPLSFKVAVQSYFQVDSMQLINFRDMDKLNVYPVTIPMAKVSDTLFQSTIAFPGFNGAGQKYFDVFIQDTSGKEYIYNYQKLYISDSRPELALNPETIKYAGIDCLQLEFKILNDSDEPLKDVKIACYDDSGMSSQIPFAEPVVSFEAGQEKRIFVNYEPAEFNNSRTFQIVVDVEDKYVERDEENNSVIKSIPTDHIFVKYNIGTSLNGSANDTLLLNNLWKFYIAPNALSASTVISYYNEDIRDNIYNGGQKDLKFITSMNQNDTTALKLTFKNYSSEFKEDSSAYLSVNVDTSKYSTALLEKVSFYKFNNSLGLWVKAGDKPEGPMLSTGINQSGLYGVFKMDDDKDPFIEITANGRPFVQEMLVRSKPSIGVLLQDENGINLYNSFSLKIDGNEISEEDRAYPDSLQKASTISILATPTLTSGNHTLYVEAADVNGNLSSKEIQFSVSTDFNIIVYGNYPNPFQDETYISFYIDSDNVIDDFSVKIYTTSGRLIRSKMLNIAIPDDNIKDVDYHELIWDGTDDDGNEVANGVYFAVIAGKFKGETVKHTLKIARLK
jgi:hypothetical protein